MSETATYTVEGMTCGHCVQSVQLGIGGIDDVERVEVDLASGRVEVTTEGPADAVAVRAVVEAAGYRVV